MPFDSCHLPVVALAAEPAAPAAAVGDEAPQREIFVPLADLHTILLADVQRVFITRQQYEDLAAKARAVSPPTAATPPAAVLSADYSATIKDNRAQLLGTIIVTAATRP